MGSSAKIGYVRLSTVEQNTARQLVGITLDRVSEEKVSAKNIGNRPVLREMLGFIRDGDDLMSTAWTASPETSKTFSLS